MSEQFCVFLKVKPGQESAFLIASRLNQAGAREEAGNLRFDIFLKWLETVTPLLVEPRQRVPGNEVPSDYEGI
jgi:quinol monooxygenase YgiN